MYRVLRNTHLFLGLFGCLYILMYGVSSVQMAHNKWFTLTPQVTESQWTLAARASDARVVGRELMDSHDLRGEVAQIRTPSGKLLFNVTRPGTVYQVDYAIATGETKVRENRAGFMGMLNRLHHTAGLEHNYWLINLWGVFTAIVSASLIVLGISGVYLWFKTHGERVIGGLLLAGGLGYGLTLVVMLRLAW